MYAIRQIQQARDRKIVVQLPEDFPTDSVEIIILPATLELREAEIDNVPADIHQFLTRDTSHFTADQRQAYDRVCTAIRRGRNPNEPRILGLFAGLMQVTDDFDAPLPDEDLFWGEGTDEYGMSLEP